MVAFMLILIGISGFYSLLFGRNVKKKKGEKLFLLIISTIFAIYGIYIIYLYFGGIFGRTLLVGTRRKTAFSLVDTIGIFIYILSIILGRLIYKNKKN
ncbi:hypothetical protein [Fusobacterium sp. PH5-44]|uniref:hypothetical protein n=1 Tax=unclassified Fusobacterium TaxID=2648384 RepID=UPI003D239252